MVDVPHEEPWPRLVEEATAVMRRAYAPYSDYQVGAAGLVDDGRLVVGCNVENAGVRRRAVRRVRTGVARCTPPVAAGSPTWSA